MKKYYLSVLCGYFLFSSAPALAMSCDNPINTYNWSDCVASEMIQLDQNLNEQYGKTMKSRAKEQGSCIKQAQIKWIRERDSECAVSGCSNALMSKD